MITELHLTNFKSYAYTKIEFKSFTCICGTNGSGKSNILDALAFALGVGASHLRCSNLKELLKHGEDSGHVKIVLVINNQQSIFHRHVNHLGHCDYKIDGISVSYSSYIDHLSHFNILVKVRNFIIFQGDIEHLASQSPSDLSKLIDHVSGAYEFKSQHDLLKSEYETANLLSISHLQSKKRLSNDLQLATQIQQQLDHYQSLLSNQQFLKSQFNLFQYFHLQSSINSATLQHSQLSNDLSELEIEHQNTQESFKTVHANHLSLQSQITSKSKSTASLHTSLSSLSLSHSKLSNKFNFLSNKRDQCLAKATSLESKIIARTKILSHSNHPSLSPTILSQYHSILSNFQSIHANQHAQFSKLELLNNQHQQQYNQHNLTLNDLLSDVSSTSEWHAQLSSELILLKATNNKRHSELTKLQLIHDKSKDTLHLKSNLTNQLKQVLTDLESIQPSKHTNILSQLQAIHPNILPLSSLITPISKSHHSPISLALGRYQNAIVVDNKHTAHQCIQHLIHHKLPVQLFLPLDRYTKYISPNSVDNAQPILDLIHFNEKYRNLLSTIFNKCYLVPDLAIAKHLAFQLMLKIKLITPEGMLIHKNKSISGGSNKNVQFGDQQGLLKKKQDLIRQLSNMGDQMVDSNRLHQLQSEIDSGVVLIQEHQLILTELNEKLELLGKQQHAVEMDIKDAQQQMDASTADLEVLKGELDHLRQLQLQPLLATTGLTMTQLEEQATTTDEMDMENTKLKLNLDLKKKELINRTIREIKETLIEVKRDMGEIELEKRDIKVKLEAAEGELNNLKREQGLVDMEMHKVQEHLNAINKQIVDIHSQLGALGNEISRDTHKLDKMELEGDMELPVTLQQDGSTTMHNKLKKELELVQIEIEEMQVPSGHSNVDMVRKQLQQQEQLLRKSTRETKELKLEYQGVKEQMEEKYSECFNAISGAIDTVYKGLTGSKGTAYLTKEEDHVTYTVMPPSKRYRQMENLSGGEKTMAAMALVFAIQAYKESPFMILDEVDAALDVQNTRKMVGFVMQQKKQIIMISHKQMVLETAKGLIGIYKREGDSVVVGCDLEHYE